MENGDSGHSMAKALFNRKVLSCDHEHLAALEAIAKKAVDAGIPPYEVYAKGLLSPEVVREHVDSMKQSMDYDEVDVQLLEAVYA